MRKIFDGVADEKKTFELINRGYTPDVFKAGDWFECMEAEYWYFLECMPPMDFKFNCFSICEFSTGSLTNAFAKMNGRFYCMTIKRTSAEDFFAAMGALNKAVDGVPA